MALPSFGAISGGQGGVSPDLSAGPSSAGGNRAGGAGGQVFNFAPPVAVQQTGAFGEAVAKPLMLLALVGVVWALSRNK